MALGIVKYAYDRSSQLIGVIWFAVSCCGPEKIGQRTIKLAYIIYRYALNRCTTCSFGVYPFISSKHRLYWLA